MLPVVYGEKITRKYILYYVPELIDLDHMFLHCRWVAPKSVLSNARIKLGETYPYPIVDLKMSRLKALEAFNTLKSS